MKYPNVNDLMLDFHFVEIKLLLKELGQFEYVALDIAKPQYLILISIKPNLLPGSSTDMWKSDLMAGLG